MSKYGSSSIMFLVDGYNLSVNKLQGLSYKFTSLTEPTHGIGDSWEEHTPVGLSRAELTQEGAFFDSSTSEGFLHVLSSTSIGGQAPSSTADVVCIEIAGNTSGKPFVGFKGEFLQDYEVLGSVGKLIRANRSYVVTGNAEHGTIVRPLEGGVSTHYLDSGAASTNGAAAYVQVSAIDMAGATGLSLNLWHEASSSTTTNILGLVSTTGIGGWRIESTDDNVNRWFISTTTFTATTGTPSITYFVGFSRL